MKTSVNGQGIGATWPPEVGEIITFKSRGELQSAILQKVRWGLVWRDFILDDGRVIAEHKVLGCPEPPVWRKPEEITQDEREAWEERLVALAESEIDPRDREQSFWAELTQYLAYIYLKFRRTDATS